MGRLMADIGDIVVTAHSDDADDDDGMVPASGATASGATPSGATPSGATASGCRAAAGYYAVNAWHLSSPPLLPSLKLHSEVICTIMSDEPV